MNLIRLFEITQKFIKLLKVIAYLGSALFLYSNFIGPEGVAELLRKENPSEKGIEVVGLLIPNYVLIWTIGTVILEVIDNFLENGQPFSRR